MRISTLLDVKGTYVAKVTSDQSIADAITELSRNGVGALVVSRDGDHLDGIISERDIVRQLNRHGAGVLGDDVGSIMSSPVFSCSPDDDVVYVMRAMTEQRIRHVPVLSYGTLVGIVSIGDVVKSRINELEADRSSLLNYIGAR